MPEEKKIIIDEDWKNQVEAEKEQLQREREQPAQEPAGGPERMRMPPASWEMLLTTLATEAMVALGQIPHPGMEQAEVDLERAKYVIDTLAILEQKTKGNLTEGESQGLEQLLHQLHMAFVAVQRGAGSAGGPGQPPS